MKVKSKLIYKLLLKYEFEVDFITVRAGRLFSLNTIKLSTDESYVK